MRREQGSARRRAVTRTWTALLLRQSGRHVTLTGRRSVDFRKTLCFPQQLCTASTAVASVETSTSSSRSRHQAHHPPPTTHHHHRSSYPTLAIHPSPARCRCCCSALSAVTGFCSASLSMRASAQTRQRDGGGSTPARRPPLPAPDAAAAVSEAASASASARALQRAAVAATSNSSSSAPAQAAAAAERARVSRLLLDGRLPACDATERILLDKGAATGDGEGTRGARAARQLIAGCVCHCLSVCVSASAQSWSARRWRSCGQWQRAWRRETGCCSSRGEAADCMQAKHQL